MEKNDLIREFKNRDRVISALSESGNFRLALIRNTKSARTAQDKHNLPVQPASYLAKMLSTASMLAVFLKGEERIILELISENSPVSKLYAEAIQVGEVRGYVDYNQSIYTNRLQVHSPAYSNGMLRISRVLYDNPEPVIGLVELIYGKLEKDIMHYFLQSEQIPTMIHLDVDSNRDGKIIHSSGFIIQALPGATENEILEAYNHYQHIVSLNKIIDRSESITDVIEEVAAGKFNVMKNDIVDFYCRCSKDKFIDKLITLEPEELMDMNAQGHNELVCHYCNTKYHLNNNDFETMLTIIQSKRN